MMDGSGHRDAHDACPVSSMHAFQLGERVGCASGVAHAARSPRSRGPDPRQKPRREGARKPASNVAARRAPEGWCARGGVDASGRYAGSMTERVPGDSTRRAPTLAAARPSREHPSWVMLARIVPGHGRFTPSVVRRSGLARRRRRASRVGQRMVRCGYVPRLDIFLECYTEAATRRVPKRATGSSVSRFSTASALCKRIRRVRDFANPDKYVLSHAVVLSTQFDVSRSPLFPNKLAILHHIYVRYGSHLHDFTPRRRRSRPIETLREAHPT